MDDVAPADPNVFDQAASPSGRDPFGQFGPPAASADAAPPASPAPTSTPDDPNDPFAKFGPVAAPPESSGSGAFARGAARSLLPSAAGLAAAGSGAEAGAAAGAAVGAAFPPAEFVSIPAGALIGGFGAMFAGSTAVGKAQDYALSKLPDTYTDALDKQQSADEQQHPNASFLGGLVPFALTMSPTAATRAALPANATALQRLMTNPVTARLFGGAVMGGTELGQESVDGQTPDWAKVGIATGFGMVFNRPNRIGEAIHEAGAGPTRTAAERLRGATPEAPTVAQAGDAKVMGPGITEGVFQGTEQQHPAAEAAVQDTARTEQATIGEPPAPDLHAVARTMEPELFERYDALSQQRDAFRSQIAEAQNPPDEALSDIAGKRADLETQLAAVPTSGAGRNLPEARRLRAQLRDVQSQYDALNDRRTAFTEGRAEETPETAQIRQHMMAVDYEMRDMGREVAAAYRRAAEHANAPMVPAEQPPSEGAPAPTEPLNSGATAAPEPAETPNSAAEPNANPVEPGPEAPSAPPLPGAGRTVEQQRTAIAADVTRRLTAAGEPADRAEVAGKLLAARYITRAARFEGKLGTAEDIYREQGPGLVGPQGGAPSLPFGGAQDTRLPTGRSAAVPKNQGITDFLARAGGLKDSGDLRGITGGENPFVPGAGRLIRPTGLSMDEALRAATDAGFLHDEGEHTAGELKNDPRALLELLDKEARGEKQYRQGQAPDAAAPESDAEKQTIETSARTEMQKFGIDPKKVDAGTMSRVVDMLYRGDETDPLAAYEKAVMERSEQHEDVHDARVKDTGEIPGWDLPAEPRSAPGAGEAAPRAEEGEAQAGEGTGELGAAARDAGERDREARLLDEARELFQKKDGPFDFSNPGGPNRTGAWGRDTTVGDTNISYSVKKNGIIEIGLIKTRDGRGGQGSARRALEEFVRQADQEGLKVALTAEPMNTTVKKGRLVDFYKSLGFKDNAGRVKDFETQAGMIREPNPSAREYDQIARGSIKIRDGRRPIVTLMKDANASTFIHETGHQWLEELMQDAVHPDAPNSIKDDATTVRDWLKNDGGPLKTGQHEKFARGFEQYLREGVAPSAELSGVFAKFKNWLTNIYQTLKGLGKPINDDVRGVFDRMLEMEPQRTVVAPDRVGGPTLPEIHEADAAETEPHEAEAAADRIAAERERYVQEPPEDIRHEIENALAAAESARAAGDGAVGPAEVDGGSSGPELVPESSGVGAGGGEVGRGRSEAKAEGSGVSGPELGRGTGKSPELPLAPSPATLFGPDESPFTDRAGNIRLDTLTTSEAVKQAIRDAADANNDFIGERRGVITDGQVMDLADALGMDARALSARKIGQAFNAEQIMAARKLLLQSAADVSTAMKRAAVGTDEDVMAYAMAKDRHQMIQGQVTGITAEAGRALRAFRNIAGQDEAQGVDQFLRGATGKTLFQLRAEAKLGSTLETPLQVSKFMQDAQKPSFGRMLLEYFVNNLISGPATHTTYAVGNTIMTLEKIGPETLASAGFGVLRKAMGREGEAVRFGEVAAQLRAAKSGFLPAVKAAVDAVGTNVTTLLPGEDGSLQRNLPFQPAGVTPALLDEGAKIHDVAGSAFGLVRGMRDAIVSSGAMLKAGGLPDAPIIGAKYSPQGAIPNIQVKGVDVLPVGDIVRAPGRLIAGIHSFFRSMNYSIDKGAIAYRTAANEGLTGTALDSRVADIRQNPDQNVMEQARGTATQLTLMGQGGEFVRKLTGLTNATVDLPLLGATQPLKFIDPFVHIAANVIDQSLLQRTPLGFASAEVRADLMGKNGNVAQDKAAGKMLVGTALGLTFGFLKAQGLVNGSEPEDKGQAMLWRMAGNQAHSVRIGDMWYDVHRLGAIGMLMGVAADMYDVAHSATQGDMLEAAAAFHHAVVQNVLDESFVKGPADLIQAVEDPGRYGEAYLRNFASSFVPYSVGMQQLDRASDPYSRQARTVMDSIRSKVPGLSEGLFPKRDIWGEPMPNRSVLGVPGLSAIYEQQISKDPVNLEMFKLGVTTATLERKIRNVDLTDAQYDDFSRVAGRMAKSRLDAIVRSPGFQTWPDHVKHDLMKETVTQSREAARNLMMMKYPTIVASAQKAKMAKLTGEPVQ